MYNVRVGQGASWTCEDFPYVLIVEENSSKMITRGAELQFCYGASSF